MSKPLDLSADEFCDKYNCIGCSKMFAFWLDEEYEEPHCELVEDEKAARHE